MINKRGWIILSGFMLFLLLAGVALVAVLVINTKPSEQEIEKWSYEYVGKVFHLRSGRAQVIAIKTVNTAKLIDTGITGGPLPSPDLPLALVIVKGDFDDASLPGFGSFSPAQPFQYAGLVFDLNPDLHTPKMVVTSPDEKLFKDILRNSGLSPISTTG